MMSEPEYLELPEWARGEVLNDNKHQVLTSKDRAKPEQAISSKPEETFELGSDRFLLEVAKIRSKRLQERSNRKWYIKIVDFFRW